MKSSLYTVRYDPMNHAASSRRTLYIAIIDFLTSYEHGRYKISNAATETISIPLEDGNDLQIPIYILREQFYPNEEDEIDEI